MRRLVLEPGMVTVRWPARSALRMRASMSAMGSVMDMMQALPFLVPERHPEVLEQGSALVVGPGRGVDADVHARHLVELFDVDLGEDQDLLDPEGVVAPAVERLAADATEVAGARQRDQQQPIEEVPHLRATEGDHRTDLHALAQLEGRDRLL